MCFQEAFFLLRSDNAGFTNRVESLGYDVELSPCWVANERLRTAGAAEALAVA